MLEKNTTYIPLRETGLHFILKYRDAEMIIFLIKIQACNWYLNC